MSDLEKFVGTDITKNDNSLFETKKEYTYRIKIDYDELAMSAMNLVEDLDNVLKKHGVRLEVENVEHDGYDVCIVKVGDK